jgi:hypothetical protein
MGRTLVLDTKNHRVLALDSEEHLLRYFGGIGQEVGRMYYPTELVSGPNGFYVYEGSSGRLQTFNAAGEVQGDCMLPIRLTSLALDREGNLLTFAPSAKELVTVFRPDCTRVRGFGTRKTLRQIYGNSIGWIENERTTTSINRISIITDTDDSVFVAYTGAPLLQKYDRYGHLLAEKFIEGATAASIRAEMAKSARAPARRTIAGDNGSTPFITTGMALNPRTRNLYVSLFWKDGWIAECSPSLQTLSVRPVPKDIGALESIAVSPGGDRLYGHRISTKEVNRVFVVRLNVP